MSRFRSPGRGERGVALVAAVFLLVVLSAIGAVAVRLALMQQQTVSSGLQAAQAFQAARSGVAWAAHRAVNLGSCGPGSLSLTEAGLAGFRVDVGCSQTSHAEGGETVNVFVISVLAERGSYGQADYVSRQLEAKVVR